MSNSHNPVFNRVLKAPTVNQEAVDAQFEQITAGNKMTFEGTSVKIAGLFIVLLAAAGATWLLAPGEASFPLLLPSALIGFGLALWLTFSRKINPVGVVAYAAVEGVFLGSLSSLFEQIYPGIVYTAVMATLVTAGGMFAAYYFGLIKVDARFTRIMFASLIGYGLFSLVNFGFSMFTGGQMNAFTNNQWGWAIALVGVGLAAFTLNLDFEDIKQGVAKGLPAEYEWRAAFGLTVTLIWLYVEILRLLSILRRE
jgi:uncharacterized YccA/Bax inhibitor family protein